ncbi:hypothetical protein SOVF_067590 isoform A [Spinacia oleracea]|nr:hypothetical protein SOVF_067590 isoform A [Spinacia oleracea]
MMCSDYAREQNIILVIVLLNYVQVSFIVDSCQELELKKKADEKQKAKEMEAAAVLEKEAESANPELLMVKERLEALEETLKDIVVETKKRPIEEKRKNADQHQHQHQERADPNSKSGDNHIHTPVKTQPTQEATSG